MKNLGLYKDNLSIPRKQEVDGLTKRVDDAEAQLTVLDSDINAAENNIASINNTMKTKLTTPTGTKGQLLGFTANNVVGAVSAPRSGVDVVVQSAKPSGQTTKDLWYQVI